ncbi:amino acid permease [Catenovulum agarivorans]|uniref:amino acid permease n=1 Tax=Catenovulum agarivorans TaxID=1172192 RepID=UPI0003097E9C|nr:amino acid permease [Catenovulum agarivorans]
MIDIIKKALPENSMTAQDPTKFGTFGGVFTPCVLTILGVIMFLRFGEVVGQSGIWYAIVIILAAKSITLLTAFSLSAIATNVRMKGGGAYFLISRSLGAEFGAVIAVVFFLAQAVSVAMYIIGFTEAFKDTFPDTGLSTFQIASIVNLITFVCVYIGAGWTIKVQYGIFVLLLLAIGSFFIGALGDISLDNFTTNIEPSFRDNDNLFTMFALFFPAVTGIMAGANMSGDLRNPSKSIPKGTLWAIFFTAIIYILMGFLLAGSRSQDQLLGNAMIVKEISVSGALIVGGVFAATLSSALASMMGAPRILQAFARDNIVPSFRFFAVGSGKTDEPKRATILTFAVAQLGILLGDLNAIAPIISMFFMITYGTLNLACFYEGWVGNPSYRPRFRFAHWSVSLLGAVSCVVVMFLMNPLWAVVSIIIMVVLYWLISSQEVLSRWGDLKSGRAYEAARKALLALEQQSYHPKNWRPSILVLSGSPTSRPHLAEYGQWLASGQGIVSIAQIIPAAGNHTIERRQEAENRIRKFIREEGLQAFPVVVSDDGISSGLKTILQAHGLGAFKPNTVMMGTTTNKERWGEYCESIRIAARKQRSILLCDCVEERQSWEPPQGRIDILWKGEKHGALMLLLGHLLKRNPEWRTRQLRILATLPTGRPADKYQKGIEDLLNIARIDASVHVFSGDNDDVIIAKRTGNTAVLFMPFEPPTNDEEEASFYDKVTMATRMTADVILVYSAGGVCFEA